MLCVTTILIVSSGRLCFFTVLSLVTSIINLTFASAMKDQDKIRLRVVEDAARLHRAPALTRSLRVGMSCALRKAVARCSWRMLHDAT